MIQRHTHHHSTSTCSHTTGSIYDLLHQRILTMILGACLIVLYFQSSSVQQHPHCQRSVVVVVSGFVPTTSTTAPLRTTTTTIPLPFLSKLRSNQSILKLAAATPPSQDQQQQQQYDNQYEKYENDNAMETTTTTTTLTSSIASANNLTTQYDDDDDDDDDESDDIDGDSTLTKTTFRERYTTTVNSNNNINSATTTGLRHLPLWLFDKCDECGYIYPTRIQEKVLDALLLLPSSSSSSSSSSENGAGNGIDLIVQSETGSGKTLAFLLPAIASIDASRSAVQVLIVVPTRELGLQIARVAKRLAAAPLSSTSSSSSNVDTSHNNDNHNRKKIMIMSVLQGSQNRRQRAWAWAEPPHMIIGTPTELCVMIRSGGIKRYNSIKYLVVDEVDACLLNNNNNNYVARGSSSSTAGSSSSSSSVQFTGTPLHELLSKYLSPTYDDGVEAIAMVSDSATVSFGPNNNNHQRPMLQSRTTIFCSATIPQHRYFAKQCVQNQWMLRTPTYISLRVGSLHLPTQLRHSYIITSEEQKKLATLRRIMKKILTTCQETNIPKRVLIFSDTQRPLEEMAKVIANDLNGLYYNEQTMSVISKQQQQQPDHHHQALTSVLRYEDSLSQRAVAMDVLRGSGAINTGKTVREQNNMTYENDDDDDDDDDADERPRDHSYPPTILLRVLLSTDLAARGIDIVDITHIIQMDIPDSVDMYVHRAGRTGRLNRSGQVITIITKEQEFVLQRIINQLQVDITCMNRPTATTI